MLEIKIEQLCELLGMTKEELGDKIIDQAVNNLLYSTSLDEDNSPHSYSSKLKQKLQSVVEEKTIQAVEKCFNEKVLPSLGGSIENLIFQKTSQYGDKKEEPLGFKEFIAKKCEAWISANVDESGKEVSYKGQPRIEQMIVKQIEFDVQYAVSRALETKNKEDKLALQQAITNAIKSWTEKK